MAVTAIWDIKGRVDKVINYVSNPEKTTEKGLDFAASLHAIDDGVISHHKLHIYPRPIHQ